MNIHGIINARSRMKRWLANGWSFSIESRDGVNVYAIMKPMFSHNLFENHVDGVLGIPNRRIVTPHMALGLMVMMLYRFDAVLVLK